MNELALYFILLLVMGCGLPLPTYLHSPVGWTIISLIMVVIVYNLAVIAYSSIIYFILYNKRHRSKIPKIIAWIQRKPIMPIQPTTKRSDSLRKRK